MASKKFEKDSIEWSFFMELWKISQEYWIPEEENEYKEKLYSAIEDFKNKYAAMDGDFVKDICNALLLSIMRRSKSSEKKEIGKVYTDRWACECVGKPCDYFRECRCPKSCYRRRFENGMEIREYARGFDCGNIYTFKTLCRRDDEPFKRNWNKDALEKWIEEKKAENKELQCDFDALKAELQEFELWEE